MLSEINSVVSSQDRFTYDIFSRTTIDFNLQETPLQYLLNNIRSILVKNSSFFIRAKVAMLLTEDKIAPQGDYPKHMQAQSKKLQIIDILAKCDTVSDFKKAAFSPIQRIYLSSRFAKKSNELLSLVFDFCKAESIQQYNIPSSYYNMKLQQRAAQFPKIVFPQPQQNIRETTGNNITTDVSVSPKNFSSIQTFASKFFAICQTKIEGHTNLYVKQASSFLSSTLRLKF